MDLYLMWLRSYFCFVGGNTKKLIKKLIQSQMEVSMERILVEQSIGFP